MSKDFTGSSEMPPTKAGLPPRLSTGTGEFTKYARAFTASVALAVAGLSASGAAGCGPGELEERRLGGADAGQGGGTTPDTAVDAPGAVDGGAVTPESAAETGGVVTPTMATVNVLSPAGTPACRTNVARNKGACTPGMAMKLKSEDFLGGAVKVGAALGKSVKVTADGGGSVYMVDCAKLFIGDVAKDPNNCSLGAATISDAKKGGAAKLCATIPATTTTHDTVVSKDFPGACLKSAFDIPTTFLVEFPGK